MRFIEREGFIQEKLCLLFTMNLTGSQQVVSSSILKSIVSHFPEQVWNSHGPRKRFDNDDGDGEEVIQLRDCPCPTQGVDEVVFRYPPTFLAPTKSGLGGALQLQLHTCKVVVVREHQASQLATWAGKGT